MILLRLFWKELKVRLDGDGWREKATVITKKFLVVQKTSDKRMPMAKRGGSRKPKKEKERKERKGNGEITPKTCYKQPSKWGTKEIGDLEEG